MQPLAAVLMAGVLAGCACTQIGCNNSVEFDLAHDLGLNVKYDVEVCIDGDCTPSSLRVKETFEAPAVVAADGALWIDTELDLVGLSLDGDDYSGSHELRVVVRDETGEVLTDHSGTYEFTKTEPNGGGFCGPTCWHASVQAPAAAAP